MSSNMERAGYEPVNTSAAVPANRAGWDAAAQEYPAEHGEFLGVADLVWGPEGIIEDDVALLGQVRGLRVLEVGCGAAQGGRWAQAAGAQVVGIDLSLGMLRAGAGLSEARGVRPDIVTADGMALPLVRESFELACT